MEQLVFPPDRLERLGARIFEAIGAEPDIAAELASALVEANLAGHDSHGVLRIPMYVEMARREETDPRARPEVVLDRGATALVNGRWGFGHVVGRFAIDEAVARARTYGVAAVGLVRCNHLGRLGSYMERAAARDCAELAWVGGIERGHQAVPYGGSRSAYGANPIAVGFPAGDAGPVVVDFATTAVAGGKVLVAQARGEEVPPGWIVDREGQPTTDPSALEDGGALLPFGGHKGYGLAFVTQLLAQALTGADETGDGDGGGVVFHRAGALFVAIDAGAFRPASETVAVGEAFVRRVRKTPPAPGFDRVMTPGEPEARTREERLERGIPLSPETWTEITAVARSVGLPEQELPSAVGEPTRPRSA